MFFWLRNLSQKHRKTKQEKNVNILSITRSVWVDFILGWPWPLCLLIIEPDEPTFEISYSTINARLSLGLKLTPFAQQHLYVFVCFAAGVRYTIWHLIQEPYRHAQKVHLERKLPLLYTSEFSPIFCIKCRSALHAKNHIPRAENLLRNRCW